jgi:hypothetical protein
VLRPVRNSSLLVALLNKHKNNLTSVQRASDKQEPKSFLQEKRCKQSMDGGGRYILGEEARYILGEEAEEETERRSCCVEIIEKQKARERIARYIYKNPAPVLLPTVSVLSLTRRTLRLSSMILCCINAA